MQYINVININIGEALFPEFCDNMHLLNMTHNLNDTKHSLHFKGEQDHLLSGGYQPPDSGQIKDIHGSFTKCQLSCCDSTFIGIPPSFTRFVKVLFIHHSRHLPDYPRTYLYCNSIGILTIQDDQHQNHLLILGKLSDLYVS